MTIRVKGIQQTLSTLSKINRRSTEEARKELKKGAIEIRNLAREFAPFKSGALEKGIKVRQPKDTGRSFSVTITASGVHGGKNVARYAQIIHEWAGKWGVGTIAKDAGRGIVRDQYLRRASEKLGPSIERRIRAKLAAISRGVR